MKDSTYEKRRRVGESHANPGTSVRGAGFESSTVADVNGIVGVHLACEEHSRPSIVNQVTRFVCATGLARPKVREEETDKWAHALCGCSATLGVCTRGTN